MLLVKGACEGHACDSHYLGMCNFGSPAQISLLYHILCVMLLYHWFIIFKWSNYFIVVKSSNNENILITKSRTTAHLWPYKNCFTRTIATYHIPWHKLFTHMLASFKVMQNFLSLYNSTLVVLYFLWTFHAKSYVQLQQKRNQCILCAIEILSTTCKPYSSCITGNHDSAKLFT